MRTSGVHTRTYTYACKCARICSYCGRPCMCLLNAGRSLRHFAEFGSSRVCLGDILLRKGVPLFSEAMSSGLEYVDLGRGGMALCFRNGMQWPKTPTQTRKSRNALREGSSLTKPRDRRALREDVEVVQLHFAEILSCKSVAWVLGLRSLYISSQVF